MASSEQDRYILHLNHTLSMESALVDHLEKRMQEISAPKIRERVQEHRLQTIEHRDAVRRMIQSLGGTPTNGKATVQPAIGPGILGTVREALEGEKEDKTLNAAIADFAVENFEMGVYSALARIARNLGHTRQAGEFDRIRQQEEQMAEFLASCGPQIVDEAFPPTAQAA